MPGQININKFYKSVGGVDKVVTQSAYTQARRKLKGELFLYLNDLIREDFYKLSEADGQDNRWKGRRVIAVDATYLNVPDTAQTRAHYGVQENQHEGRERVQAMGRVAYDLLNDIGISGVIDRKRAEKDFLINTHVDKTQEGDVIVIDRIGADYGVMAYLINRGRDFVIRFPRAGFGEVKRFWDSTDTEAVVELRVPQSQRGLVRERGLSKTIRVRLVKVELEGGEIEVLGTSLMDKEQWKREEIKWVYGKRWAVETYFDRIKNVFEVERFSGQSVLSIEQDFYGVIFLASLQSILSKQAQQELKEHSHNNSTKHTQQVNQSVGYSAMLDYIVELFMDTKKGVEQTLEELHQLFKTNPTLSREGRKCDRTKTSSNQKLWFYRYDKRIIA